MGRIIYTIFFYLVITPLGLFLRFIRLRFFDRKFDKYAPTYWHTRRVKPFNNHDYERPY